MSNPAYLKRYLDNLVTSGAMIEIEGEPIWLIAFTGWRESDPFQPGRWVTEQLQQQERFTGLLVPHYDRAADLHWARLDTSCYLNLAEEIHGAGVYERVQDLFDLIDTEWKRMHPRSDGDDHQECSNCGERVYTLSSRLWCDGCEEQVAQSAQPDYAVVVCETLNANQQI